MKLLVVEDDRALAQMLVKAMTEAGHAVQTRANGDDAFRLLQNETFDLVLLDVMLPGMDGFTLCRQARQAKITVPILLVTARDAVDDKVEGLDSGADDYIVKPFLLAELMARVRALLRRGSSGSPAVLSVGDLTLDPATRQAQRAQKRLYFSATEYALLEYLMRNAGRTLTRSMIMEHVWQYDFNGNFNVLDVYIGYLRNKIDKGFGQALLHTVRGVGYCLEARDA